MYDKTKFLKIKKCGNLIQNISNKLFLQQLKNIRVPSTLVLYAFKIRAFQIILWWKIHNIFNLYSKG